MTQISYRRIDAAGVKIFYRTAGDPAAPTLLLMHGFPSSSHMFRDLIPLLADQFHLVAPDLPGFGRSDMPAREAFTYTFENLAKVMSAFVDRIGLAKFAVYIFDYGSPVGLRMAVAHPGTGDRDRDPERQRLRRRIERGVEADPGILARTVARRDALRGFLKPETTYFQYATGVADESMISPDGYGLDDFYLSRPGADEVQLDLLLNYETNVAHYPKFHEYFRTHRPPLLAIWGRNDPFIPPGAEAFKRDLPDAEVRFLDTGHFALETHSGEIADAIRNFLTGASVKGRKA